MIGCRLEKGKILTKLGRGAKADAEYSRVLEMLNIKLAQNPRDGNGHMMRGFALRALGRDDEARLAHERAVRIEPGLRQLIRSMSQYAP